MQDDIHLIVGEGWKGGKTILKNEKTKEFEGIMLPSSLVIAHYFEKEKKAIEKEQKQEDIERRRIEKIEERNRREKEEEINYQNSINLRLW